MDSKEIMDKDKEYFVQGYARVPIVLTEGKGAILKDLDGKEYIDCGWLIKNSGNICFQIPFHKLRRILAIFLHRI